VLLNLLSNAVRFTENALRRIIEITFNASKEEPHFSSSFEQAGEEAVTLEARTYSSRDCSDVTKDSIYLISSVIDTGVGLTNEETNNLFQKLNQISPKTHIKYSETGLGLFISKSLVEAQNGKMTLESEKGKGTKLTFYICVKRPDIDTSSAELVAGCLAQTKLPPRKELIAADSKGINVLVVEDNLVRVEMCRISLLDQSKSLNAAIAIGRISIVLGKSRSRMS